MTPDLGAVRYLRTPRYPRPFASLGHHNFHVRCCIGAHLCRAWIPNQYGPLRDRLDPVRRRWLRATGRGCRSALSAYGRSSDGLAFASRLLGEQANARLAGALQAT